MWWLWFTAIGAAAEPDPGALEIAPELLTESALSDLDRTALERAAIGGMLEYLDTVSECPGNRLLDASALAALAAENQGVREGIGAEFRIVPWRGLLITEVPPGSAAQRAGLRAGQAVVSVHGEPLDGRSAAEIADLVGQEPSGLLELEVEDPAGKRRVLLLPRSRYQLRPVRLEPGEDVDIIRIKVFSKGSATALASFLEEIDSRPVVLDLRDNPGGDLEEAVAAADLFLEEGEILGYERRRRTGTRPFVAVRPPAHLGSVVVLVNEGTRGTAELFAAALRDGGRADLVGAVTGGLACDMGIYHLPGGLAMAVTDVGFLTPLAESWSGEGLIPDHLVPLYPVDALPAAVAATDRQLDAARNLLADANEDVADP